MDPHPAGWKALAARARALLEVMTVKRRSRLPLFAINDVICDTFKPVTSFSSTATANRE